ncbi:MAG: hypothetical protein N2C14_15745, partial [Planctomycetales bacterium]
MGITAITVILGLLWIAAGFPLLTALGVIKIEGEIPRLDRKYAEEIGPQFRPTFYSSLGLSLGASLAGLIIAWWFHFTLLAGAGVVNSWGIGGTVVKILYAVALIWLVLLGGVLMFYWAFPTALRMRIPAEQGQASAQHLGWIWLVSLFTEGYELSLDTVRDTSDAGRIRRWRD